MVVRLGAIAGLHNACTTVHACMCMLVVWLVVMKWSTSLSMCSICDDDLLSCDSVYLSCTSTDATDDFEC